MEGEGRGCQASLRGRRPGQEALSVEPWEPSHPLFEVVLGQPHGPSAWGGWYARGCPWTTLPAHMSLLF